MFAVATGSAPVDVGASVAPKRETISEMPAEAYCDLTSERWASES